MGPAMNRSKILSVLALCVVLLIVIAGVISIPRSDAAPVDAIFFEDFGYGYRLAVRRNGWMLGTGPGWPGVPGARWSEDGVSLHKVPAAADGRVVRMASSTGGRGPNTRQTQVCHQRNCLEG